MTALMSTPIGNPDNLDPILQDPFACLLLASWLHEGLSRHELNSLFAGIFQVEPAGIEPATSCLQSRNRRCATWCSVVQVPAHAHKFASAQ